MSDAVSLDLERRFGGLERLYGPASLGSLSAAHVAVAGIGGVGSWCAEAPARTGIGEVRLPGLDHIAEFTINQLLHSLNRKFGTAQVMNLQSCLRGKRGS